MSWPQSYSPGGLCSPLLSIANLTAVTPVARSTTPASADFRTNRILCSLAISRFKCSISLSRQSSWCAVRGRRFQRFPREEDSDAEASWLKSTEYRMNFRATISSPPKNCAKEPRKLLRQLRVPGTLRPPPVNAFQRHG